jgi:hypothetical protein
MSDLDLALAAAFLVIAALYSSVGHAGASGYIATMALLAIPAATIKPTALALNILVATIGVFRFARAQLVPWRLVLPLIVGSVPLAYVGGALQLPAQVYQRVLAVVLASAAVNLFVTAHRALDKEAGAGVRPMPIPLGLVLGAGLGFVAGLTGTGGAIYLTPLADPGGVRHDADRVGGVGGVRVGEFGLGVDRRRARSCKAAECVADVAWGGGRRGADRDAVRKGGVAGGELAAGVGDRALDRGGEALVDVTPLNQYEGTIALLA